MLKFLKYTILGTVAFLLLSNSYISEPGDQTEGNCVSYVTVQGSSNVNQFSFNNTNPIIQDSAGIKKDEVQYQIVQIPVYSFTGKNKHMLKDFLDLIKASEYPFIILALESRDLVPCEKHTEPTNFKTRITIAGVTNAYVVPCKVVACNNNGYLVKGDLKIKLTDFNINPPQKFFGMIKVNNEVFIDYAFKFSPENDIFK